MAHQRRRLRERFDELERHFLGSLRLHNSPLLPRSSERRTHMRLRRYLGFSDGWTARRWPTGRRKHVGGEVVQHLARILLALVSVERPDISDRHSEVPSITGERPPEVGPIGTQGRRDL